MDDKIWIHVKLLTVTRKIFCHIFQHFIFNWQTDKAETSFTVHNIFVNLLHIMTGWLNSPMLFISYEFIFWNADYCVWLYVNCILNLLGRGLGDLPHQCLVNILSYYPTLHIFRRCTFSNVYRMTSCCCCELIFFSWKRKRFKGLKNGKHGS